MPYTTALQQKVMC